MNKITLQVLMASAGASFALGFGVAWFLKPDPALAPDMAVAPQAAPAAAVVGGGFGDAWARRDAPPAASAAIPATDGVDELWTAALVPQGQQAAGYDAEDRLRKLAQTDSTALRKLLQRYDSDKTPQARELLKSILSTVQTPDAIAFSTRLAGSLNVAERKYGLELLQSLAPESPETRNLIRRTLASEQSPEVLVQALSTLQSGAVEPEEAAQIVAQLTSLSQHADPAVRSQSIAQLGQWDKAGQGVDRLTQALADPAPQVRQAAVFAIAQSGIRTESVKAALIGMVNNQQESKDIRGSALQVLERFSLSKDEYANFARARAALVAR